MFTCEVCGGTDFEKYAGFLYCAICQTQSQHYHEQEHDYNEGETIIHQKSQKSQTPKKNNEEYDDGAWTSWEAFNYILYGMTQELSNCFLVPSGFESLVLKLWASYLQKCNAGFISHCKEILPKLKINFKHRDGRVLYNFNIDEYKDRRKQSRKTVRGESNYSVPCDSKRSLAQKRRKIITDHYKEFLSTSMLLHSSLHNETLESLGQPDRSRPVDDNYEALDLNKKFNFREMFSKKDYKIYKSAFKSQKLKLTTSDWAKKNVQCLAKNKLLSIIHLGLLMIGSEIQLSDLLRLIREGHLSYAKVTHFLPKDIKFGKNDFCYVEVVSDSSMPTHLRQRKILSQLAYLLQIEKIQTPNMAQLVKRYCYDLNLPEQINKLSEVVVTKWTPRITVPKAKTLCPSYEAWAMVSVIFVMKLLFGLNNKTELFLSDLAREVNKIRENAGNQTLFVFEEWQKYLECRKTVLVDFHYPTQEQLNGNAIISSENFLHMLLKESKDEHRSDRFIPYKKYYIEKNLMDCVRQTLNQLTKPINFNSIDFKPSLTPQRSHLETIKINLSHDDQKAEASKTLEIPEKILNQSFEGSTVDFAYEPEFYINLLKNMDGESLKKLRFYKESVAEAGQPPFLKSQEYDILLDCSSRYWTLHYSDSKSGNLSYFKEKVFEKTPENFQWLMTECARMLEMNVRDVYDELIALENVMMGGTN